MDLVEHYNEVIVKSAKNPLTFSLPTSFLPASLLPTSLLPIFKLFVSSLLAAFKKFNCYYASASLKRQANKIVVQNI